MDAPSADALIVALYAALFKRHPYERERNDWSKALQSGVAFEDVFRGFVSSPEYKAIAAPPMKYSPGHYHSPVVDPSTLHAYLDQAHSVGPCDIAGIDIDLPRMSGLWLRHAAVLRSTPFPQRKAAACRYYAGNGSYPFGDAAILRLMMSAHRPRQVIEVGSGFSSACVLDCADEFGLAAFSLTCIDPYPERLRGLLRASDAPTILPERVESVPLALFETLEAGDILLIDSTHVLKTGSDVCHQLFQILPRLRAGVLVHIHDCQFPFEYPRTWIVDDNVSWNEAYAVRAFLMYNRRFSIVFWNDLFAKHCSAVVQVVFAPFAASPGSALWITVQND